MKWKGKYMEEKENLEEKEVLEEAETVEETEPVEQSVTAEEQEPLFKRAESVYTSTEQPKNSNTPVIIVFVLLLLFVVGLGVFVIISLPEQLEKEIGEKTENQQESKPSDKEPSIFDFWMTDESDEESVDKSEVADESKDTDEAEDVDDIGIVDWNENWQEQFTNHAPEEFAGPYYEDMMDCIDESVSYKVNREFFEYEDEENNVCIRVSYIQLEGNIPNLENINEELKTNALWYATYYEEDSATVLNNIENSDIGYWVEAYQYVTYNNEEQISIVLNENVSYTYYSQPTLLATNINLITGAILDDTRILDLDPDFGQEFRERSHKQNGQSKGTDIFSDDEIVSMLQDEDDLILFYTPLGLELGYSYEEDYYCGWITISMQDYEKYLAGM